MTDTTSTTALDKIRARADAATEGPWFFTEGPRQELRGPRMGVLQTAALLYPDELNAEFITHARTDIPKLVAALDVVTKLHYQREDTEDVIPWSCMDGPCEHDDDCPEVAVKGCDECSTPEYIVQWPCPTVRAIAEVLA